MLLMRISYTIYPITYINTKMQENSIPPPPERPYRTPMYYKKKRTPKKFGFFNVVN